MAEKMKVTNTADLLAYVRHSLGHTPQQSVVLVGITATGVPTAGRFAADRATHLAGKVLATLAEQDLREVVTIVYHPTQAAAEAIYGAMVTSTPQLSEWCTRVVWASPTHYSRDGDTPRPIAEVHESPITTWFITQGSAPADNRDALADAFAPAPIADRRAAAAAAAAAAPSANDARDLWESAEHTPSPQAYGRLAAALTNGHARDRVLAYITMGQWHQDPQVLATVGTNTPEADRMDHYQSALALLSTTAAHNPGPGAAGALACAAMTYWWLGDGTRANIWVDAARQEDPNNRLAALIDAALTTQMPPLWAA